VFLNVCSLTHSTECKVQIRTAVVLARWLGSHSLGKQWGYPSQCGAPATQHKQELQCAARLYIRQHIDYYYYLHIWHIVWVSYINEKSVHRSPWLASSKFWYLNFYSIMPQYYLSQKNEIENVHTPNHLWHLCVTIATNKQTWVSFVTMIAEVSIQTFVTLVAKPW
jgi:hypothetical protein